MRRKQAVWGGRAVSVLVAGFVGYLAGGWNPSVSHNRELSAAQMVALRFPQDSADQSISVVAPVITASAGQTDQSQSSLLSPQPMAPVPATVSAAATSVAPQTAQVGPPLQLQMASLDPSAPITGTQITGTQITGTQSTPQVTGTTAQQSAPATMQASAPRTAAAAPAMRPSIAAAAQSNVAKLAASAHRALNERPGFVLNDAQIASIKQRLHLTPDQEEMWPAVEAALRNLAYTRAREARSKGTPANNAQIAQADPNSPEVQGLKSAAIPLLMSFNSEQKDEVRNLAHVMGLDQLASQF